MKFSARVQYGLQAMLHLADRYGESAVPVSFIAKEESISPAYLEQILNKLKKERLVKSVRGPRGGYVLTQKPGSISIRKILEVLGYFSAPTALGKQSAQIRVPQRASQMFWLQVESAFQKAFDDISLHDLIQRAGGSEAVSGATANLAFNI
ncbi:MAG: Rrf2 family transcriptional regulator [Candidatus Omnitrophica bacterium]|nr:Rrf2 family transcriptional regulator [Candidatus Omnitrophota bacterium]